jgi:ParB family chromosome partitioning protein
MPLTVSNPHLPATALRPSPSPSPIAVDRIRPSAFSITIYGDPHAEIDDLIESIRRHGVLVPLVVVAETRTKTKTKAETFEVVSGHRRLACARALGLTEVPCEVRPLGSQAARRRAVLEYNRQRSKTFSQMMREADALEALLKAEARRTRLANLRQFHDRDGAGVRAEAGAEASEGRNSDGRAGRTDTAIARTIGLGGKDLYRQARAVWQVARSGDPRAQSSLAALDAGTKTIHAAYKDLRRRDRFTAGFRPTPYDVWPFRHDRAFGIPHPGAIPPSIVAHTLHYYTVPGALVVDPMAGGGTTIDVCESMGRRCLAYDIHPVRPEIELHDVRDGLPRATNGCDLIFCDPPYHTMRARRYGAGGVDAVPLDAWIGFLGQLARVAMAALRPGGFVALLLANQTEKDLPAGWGYIDHACFGYHALVAAGFLPERRISCPMDGAYLPQHVQRARAEGRMLGQVRDLLVMRKPQESVRLRHGFAAGQLVDLAPDEGVRESRIATDDRFGE